MADLKVRLPELLAPAGKWEVLEAVMAAGADAVYLGGKKYNMRLHRQDLNFSEEELERGTELAHRRGVKLYVTVNNLLTNREVEELPDYLTFLDQIGCDALIVQDLAVIQLARELGLRIPLHASVMMNVHNAESLQLLADLGITRAILSRDISLSEAQDIHRQVPAIELEYFAHGDMCFAQGSQCYHSGMIFGESSNRGRCLKPCRWSFSLVDQDNGETLPVKADGPYFLAVKDICLLPFLPEVIDAGIVSLKIEGRMREAGYLAPLIGFYRRALDSYAADPCGYTFDGEQFEELKKIQARQLSPLYAFGHPGPASIGYTGQDEPRFFSRGVKEPLLDPDNLEKNRLPVPPTPKESPRKPLLAVRVGTTGAAAAALGSGADLIYNSGDGLLSQGGPWHRDDYRRVIDLCHQSGAAFYAGTPRITMPPEAGYLHRFLAEMTALRPDGLMVTNLGSLLAAYRETGFSLLADFSCNIANRRAAELVGRYRVIRFTAPLEFSFEEILALTGDLPMEAELVIHGTIPSMVSEHCLVAALIEGRKKYDICGGFCRRRHYGLQDSAGEVHPLEVDHNCRNYLYLANELALLPDLRSCYGAGYAVLRLEIPTYQAGEAGTVTGLYRQALDRLWADPNHFRVESAELKQLLGLRRGRFGRGAFSNGIRVGCPLSRSSRER